MSNENRRLEAKDMPIFHKIKEVYRGKVWIYVKLFGNIGVCLFLLYGPGNFQRLPHTKTLSVKSFLCLTAGG
jgi:hypothetical protein